VSKAVDLWQQGDIRLLVNCESRALSPDASARFATKVAEITLMVPDAQATATRAAALRVGVEHPPIGPGEAEIPALHGIGRSLIRLLDQGAALSRVWEQDFRAAGPAPKGAGLTRIDHLGQTCAYDEMSSWALFYTSVFDASKSAVVDVADPDGLVRSQVLRSGGLRITLNGADQRRTLAGQFVEESSGSAVQHIAFACEDIFATAAALQARGFPVLQIGGNYYADLQARFGLDAGFVDRLKASNILYDEDAAGAFYQFHSIARPEGMFFEIVSRTGNYQGFGAMNAPFRIAAQKRSRKAQGLAPI
jgi:4-hydroxyphenylpyruvate dioxygenase